MMPDNWQEMGNEAEMGLTRDGQLPPQDADALPASIEHAGELGIFEFGENVIDDMTAHLYGLERYIGDDSENSGDDSSATASRNKA